MQQTCYIHPDRTAVAKIRKPVQIHTPNGVKKTTEESLVCEECAEGAKSYGTPVFPLDTVN